MKLQKIFNDELLKIFAILFTTSGIIISVYFFRFVEIGLKIQSFYMGLMLIVCGNLLAYHKVKSDSLNIHFLYIIFITTFFLSSIYDIRFVPLQGSDILSEFRTARITYENNYWSLDRSNWDHYFSAISVSMIPVIISKVTGLNLIYTFQLPMRLIGATLPLVLYMTVNEIFEDKKLSSLSAIIFSQLYFNFNLLPVIVRQNISEISLLLTIFVLIKIYKKNSSINLSYVILLIIYLFNLSSQHYYITYWSVIFLLLIVIADYIVKVIPSNILKYVNAYNSIYDRKVLPLRYFCLFIVMFLSWTALTNATFFTKYITSQLYLISGGAPVELTGEYQVSWIFGSPAGLVVTFWFLFEALLSPLGFLYVLLKYPKRKSHIIWIVMSGFVFLMLALWISPGFSAGLVYVDRIYLVGSLFFTTFIAFILRSVNNKFRIVIPLFLLINLPMNLLVPSYDRYVIYNKEDNVNPEYALIQNIVRTPSHELSKWLDKNVPLNISIYADSPTGVRSLFYTHINKMSYSNLNITSLTKEISQNNTYFFFHHYNLNFEKWQKNERDIQDISINIILNRSYVIYNNGEAVLSSLN